MSVEVDRGPGRSLASVVAARAAAQPRATALVVGERSVSYGELLGHAAAQAGSMTERLGRRPQRVGIFGHRSLTSLSAPLSALFAGASFVPLNPRLPVERQRAVARQADLDAVIVDEFARGHVVEVLGALPAPPLVLLPEEERPSLPGYPGEVLGAADVAGAAPLRAPAPLVPEDPACLLFTSGSTGVPKGVPVLHGNVLAFLDAVRERFALGPEDRVAQVSDQTFDLSLFDLFATWEAGGAVCSLGAMEVLAPSRSIARLGCTVWFSVPSVIAHLRARGLLRPGSLDSLRLSLFAGEPLPLDSALAWGAAAPQSAIHCLYGPTETTIVNFGHRFDAQRSPALCERGIVPIGRPFPGTACVVVDESLQVVSHGEPGELLAAGAQVTPCYWRDEQQSGRRHLRASFDGGPPRHWFRTGDRVRRLPGGDYAFLGRVDEQVKVHGHRIELGEIEAALRRGAGVVEAVAVAWPLLDGGSADGVAAFVVGRDLDAEALRRGCAALLPPRAVPSRILVVESVPRTASGKADRRALCRGLDESLLAPAGRR